MDICCTAVCSFQKDGKCTLRETPALAQGLPPIGCPHCRRPHSGPLPGKGGQSPLG